MFPVWIAGVFGLSFLTLREGADKEFANREK